MSVTHSSATRRNGHRARSALCVLTLLAAVSACSDSGTIDKEQQPKPISQVEPSVSEPQENENEPWENEPGENEPGENEPGENEPGENEGGGNEA